MTTAAYFKGAARSEEAKKEVKLSTMNLKNLDVSTSSRKLLGEGRVVTTRIARPF
jgi:hypothetical protein